MEIEDVFSSKLRMKILKILTLVGELNVSQIARRLRANYRTTNEHLKVLREEGIVNHRIFGRVHMYKFNRSSPKALAVQNLIQVWNDQNTRKEN